MIEILILYVLYKREKTIYSVRKDIIELFGNFTKPSAGTIYPALKRMLEKKFLSLNERMSEGGKKSSYYLITDSGKKYFRELFFEDCSENPSLFFSQLQSKLATTGLLSRQDKSAFLELIQKSIDIYIFDMENKMQDKYIDFDENQKELLAYTISEAKNLREFAKKLSKI